MNELTYEHIIKGFREHDISEDDYIKNERLYAVLSDLNGSDFDPDIYNQLWDECRLNSHGEAKASDFCHLVLKAEKILSDNEREAISTEASYSSQHHRYAEQNGH